MIAGNIERIRRLHVRRLDTGETLATVGREAWCLCTAHCHRNARCYTTGKASSSLVGLRVSLAQAWPARPDHRGTSRWTLSWPSCQISPRCSIGCAGAGVHRMTAYRVFITPTLNKEGRPRRSSKGSMFDASHEGQVIVVGSTEPCLAAARVLKARGLSGRLEMWDTVLPYCRFHTDIDKAAGLTIEEGDGLPRLRKYRAYPGGDAQDGDFASGGIPVAQTGESRSSESPAALGQISGRAAGMRGKANKKGRSKGSLSDFVPIERYIMRSLAWRSLTTVARAVYPEVGFHYTGENNGRIVISVRGIAASLGISKDTAARALQMLGGARVYRNGQARRFHYETAPCQ